MSRYLIDQIDRSPNIRTLPRTEVTGLVGEQNLTGVNLRDNANRMTSTTAACGLFVFIGAKPCTEWLGHQLAADADGFLLTRADLPPSRHEWADRAPLRL